MMKYLKMMVALVICTLFMSGFNVCAADYTIDFTRDEAYEAVMAVTPEQAEREYGGKSSYYAALTDSDKEALFEMMWNGTVSGVLYSTKGTIKLATFMDDYFSSVISAFRQTKSDDEGLTNLRNRIDEINAEYFSEGIQSNVEIVEKTEPTESGETETTIQTRPPVDEYESGEITTVTTIAAEKPHSHTALIVFLSFVVIAVGAAAGYLIYRKRKS